MGVRAAVDANLAPGAAHVHTRGTTDVRGWGGLLLRHKHEP